METESKRQASVKLTPGEEFHLTYDEYYGNKQMGSESGSGLKIGEGGMIEKSMTFEQYVKENKSEQIFDNDMLELQYKFWETNLEREQRLKKVWIDMRRRNALGGVDEVTP